MHEWFATPIAAARGEQAARRRRVHQLRVAAGRDAWSRTAGPVVVRAGRAAERLATRRIDAGVAALLADGPSRRPDPTGGSRPRYA